MKYTASFQVYNASAGSGKTFSLVKEYLKIVLSSPNPEQFKHILAITFTNKAANEMKARIVKNLQQFSDENILRNPTDMFLKIVAETNINPSTIHQRAGKVLQQILTQYGAFSVSTIDSFTHKLIRNFAFDLGLPLKFEVELKSKLILDLAVEQLIAKIGIDDDLTDFLIDFALSNIEDNKSWDFTTLIKDKAMVLLDENDRIHFQQTQHIDLIQFKLLNQNLISHQKKIEQAFKNLGTIGLKLMTEHEVESYFFHHDLPNYFKKLINFRKHHESIKFDGRLAKKIDTGVLYSASLPYALIKIIEEITEPLIAIYQQSKLLFEVEYPNYNLAQIVSKSISAYAVLNHLNKELQQLKKEQNLLLSAEFNQLISNEIKNQPAPFIYEKLGSKYQHYFIDEMQDTSQLQWQNLIPLIENALSQEGGSLMLVGDAKQSIYRWRGGKTEQFMTLASDEKKEGSNPFMVEKKLQYLDTNFRSFKSVVQFNNDFFTHIARFLVDENHQKLFLNTVKQAIKQDEEGGYVHISFVEKEEDDEDKFEPYLKRIKTILDQLDSNFAKNEVCILVRKNKQGVAVANYLINEGIAVVSSESLLLSNSEKVSFIILLLNYLDQPLNHSIQFKIATFLYRHLAIAVPFHDFAKPLIKLKIFDFFKKLIPLAIDFKPDLFFQKPLYEAVEYLISVFKLAPESDAYIQFFLDFVLEYQSKEQNNLAGFLAEWEHKKADLSIIAPENTDAVRIMTVHKAKGLEFQVVIFPFDLEINKELNGQTWIKLSDADYKDLPTMKVKLTKQILNIGAIGEQLYQQRQDELWLDNFNLLYVAFTRAIEQLYVISEIKKVKKESPEIVYFSDLLKTYLKQLDPSSFIDKDFIFESGFPDKKHKSSEKSSINVENQLKTIIQKNYIGANLAEQQVHMVTTGSKFWGTSLQEAAIYGNKIHRLLAQIKTADDIEKTLTYAQNSGLISAIEQESMQNQLQKIVQHPQLQALYQSNLTVFNEREILTDLGEIIIPDRIVINPQNQATIIDYKTGNQLQEHQNQLNNYAFYVEKMGYKVIAKLLVYSNEVIEVREIK